MITIVDEIYRSVVTIVDEICRSVITIVDEICRNNRFALYIWLDQGHFSLTQFTRLQRQSRSAIVW